MKSTDLYSEYGRTFSSFKSADNEAMELIRKASHNGRWYDIVDRLAELRSAMRIDLESE